MLVEIPKKGDEQYASISILEATTFNDEEKQALIKQSIEKLRDELYRTFNDYCRKITDGAKDLIKSYLAIKDLPEIDIALAIELFEEPYNPSKGGLESLKVYTAFRDYDTYKRNRDATEDTEKRGIGTVLYSVKENSDFNQCLANDKYIMNNATADHSRHYSPERGYLKFYNCSMVLPIRIRNGEGDYTYFGFVCCDCFKKTAEEVVDVFDTTSAQMLFMYAQNLGTFLETMDSNWVDRTEQIPSTALSSNILQLLKKRIYKGE